MTTIQVTQKETAGNDTLRAAGRIPVVYYGLEQEAKTGTIDEIAFQHAWQEAGETTAIVLDTVDGKCDALIHDLQRHPVSGKVIHVDFLLIDKSKEIEVHLPLSFTGTAPIEKSGDGRIVRVLHEIEVKGKPDDIPHELNVDLSSLASKDDQILIKDLALPANVAALGDADEVVVAVTGVREEPEEEETEAIDLDSIEVEQKGKQEEETTTDEAA